MSISIRRNSMANTRILSLTLAAMFGAVATGLCSHAAAEPRGKAMPLGERAMAPIGFAIFCDRNPLECGGATVAAAPAPAPTPAPRVLPSPGAPTSASMTWVEAFRRARGERDMATGALLPVAGVVPAAGNGARWLDEARLGGGSAAWRHIETPPAALEAAPAVAMETRVALTRDNLKLLQRINRRINKAIRPATDQALYGIWDVWSEPLRQTETAVGRPPKVYGDCEDYVLEKRRALIAAGLPARALSIGVARNARGDIHAVLLVQTDRGEFVLDNLSPWILAWEDVGYSWVMRQVNGDAKDWRRIETGNGIAKGQWL
jgi:predicted transglutaminase-like cysteine proteinase